MSLKTLVASFAVITSLSSGAVAEPLKVVTTFSILEDFVRQVGGERVAITNLVGPDGDTHVYEPRPADATALGDADLVIVNGRHLEGFIDRLIKASATEAPIVEASRSATELRLGEEGGHAHHGHDDGDGHHHNGDVDPHAWQSVPNAIAYVRTIEEALCAQDAGGCATYKANADAYATRLEALDAEIRAAIDQIPAEKRRIITAHDAFGYFEQAYGVEFMAPEGVSTASEASAADVAALIRQIREDHASAIFIESISDPRLVQQIASETGLTIGGSLYSDALSAAGGPASSYIEMMRHNTQTLVSAIGTT